MLPLSSSSSSSSSHRRHKYDVFLSFRGEDTRKSFTDHLYSALKGSGIITFRDNDRLEAGQEIRSELLKAIEESWCSIIVFSKTYTFSRWCLDEVAEIVKQKNERGHKVFPIFYDVDPSHLRTQTGKVEEAFAKYEGTSSKDDKDKTQKWRSALTQVASLKGWHLNNRHESEFIEDVVKKVSIKLCQTYSVVQNDLIGISTRLEELHSKIEIGEDDVRIIGICGMGGIGKTTLARAVYTQMSPHFKGKCFLANVREVSEKYGLVSLQKQLLSRILLEEDFHLFNVYDGNDMISRRLSLKKVLVVVDDVANIQHLKCLVGRRDWFGSGSRIIITTRNEHLLQSYRVDDVYKPTTLNANEALSLFNLKAFNSVAMPGKDDFLELSKRVVEYADGLPLALEVMGSFLCGRDVPQWRSAIERLKKDSNKEILDRLQISFDGLEETEKNIFLDIACFFKGEEKNFVMKILDGCEFFPDIGIHTLIKKSLITIDEYDRLRMHDLLQEMGRKIVRQKSVDEPGKRCRLWEERDVYHVLTENKGTEVVEGMIINIKSYQVTQTSKFWGRKKTFILSGDVFSKMTRLRVLRVFSPQYFGEVKYLSKELRLLEWPRYPFKSLPSSFQLHNLVALLLPGSRIEQLWIVNSQLEKLKLVNLEYSQNLVRTPTFAVTPNLESLILEGCTRLIDVHPSIGELRGLKLLNLRDCKNLKRLPTRIGMQSLEKLILSGCSSLEKFPEIINGEMKHLGWLYLDGTNISEIPSSIKHLSSLTHLDLKHCRSLKTLPTEIGRMESLAELYLSGCSSLEKFPDIIDGEMKHLIWLFLDGTNISELPSSIGYLSSLTILDLRDCKSLKSLPTEIGTMESLVELYLSGCSSLEKFPEIIDGKMQHLCRLYLDGTAISELPSSITHLNSLTLLDLRDCKSLRTLPTEIGTMESLATLILLGCSSLEKFIDIDGEVKCLLKLYLDGTGIEELPSSIGNLSNLVLLKLKDCKNLSSLPSSIGGLKQLHVLNLSGCSKVESLPEELQQLEYLEVFDLSETAIKTPQSFIFQFKNLKVLSFKGCKGLVFPPLSGLTSLTHLNLGGCNLCEGDIPMDFCRLFSLEELDLSGNNFISLTATLTPLSKLRYLKLLDCKRLKSFKLPTSLEFVNIEGCDSLEVFAYPTTERNVNLSYINGVNCFKWLENNNAFTMLEDYLKVSENRRQSFDAVTPGSEIPKWLSHQRDGDSIKIQLQNPLVWNDSKWMGIAFCCNFASPFFNIYCDTILMDGTYFTNSLWEEFRGYNIAEVYKPRQVLKDHLWLGYRSRENLYGLHRHKYYSRSKDLAYVSRNEIALYFRGTKIKKCGFRIVYEKDLEEIDLDFDLVKPKQKRRNNFEEEEEEEEEAASPSESETPPPKRLKQLLNFIMGKKPRF